jgi:hypothetical protein
MTCQVALEAERGIPIVTGVCTLLSIAEELDAYVLVFGL